MSREEVAQMFYNLHRSVERMMVRQHLSMAQDLYLNRFLTEAIEREDDYRIFLNLIAIQTKMRCRLQMSEDENQWLIAYINGALVHARQYISNEAEHVLT